MKEIKNDKKKVESKTSCSCNCKCTVESAYADPHSFAESNAHLISCMCDCDTINAKTVGKQLVS